MTFSKTLVRLRKQSKTSQVGMARKLGVARQTYLDLEQGKTEPRYSTLIKLAKIFNTSIAIFFLEDKEYIEIEKFIPLKLATNKQLLNELNSRLNKSH